MKKESKSIKIALADDHVILRNSLAMLIESFGDCQVICEASNGRELIDNMKRSSPPDIVILDLNMPIMDGLTTSQYLFKEFPQVRVLMLTMYDSELSLIRLLQTGVKGFLKKDIAPAELKFALHSVMESGYYYSNQATGKLVNLFQNADGTLSNLYRAILSDHEITFLKLVCSDMTYKQIAEQMALNPRSIDTIRDQLFAKLEVRSRVGLAMVAIRHGLFII